MTKGNGNPVLQSSGEHSHFQFATLKPSGYIRNMASRNTASWVIASLPLLCVGYMFLEISEAVFHFGHLPQYMVDPDPFHTDWASVFPDLGLLIYFPLPLIFVLTLLLLGLPKLRYSGNHRIAFYLLVLCSILVTWLFVIRDVTGFMGWKLD